MGGRGGDLSQLDNPLKQLQSTPFLSALNELPTRLAASYA